MRASKFDEKLFDYFFACLQSSEKLMACMSMDYHCLFILLDTNVCKAVAWYLIWFEQKSKYKQIWSQLIGDIMHVILVWLHGNFVNDHT